MTITRAVAKRQIAATRALIAWLRSNGVVDAESQQLLARLDAATEALARQAYTPNLSSPLQSR